MSSFIIEGGHSLRGNITPQGAKNEALQVICATLLTREEVIIDNVPDILDVNNLIDLIRDMGVIVKKLDEKRYSFKAEEIDRAYTQSDDFMQKSAAMRGSIMLIGPLLARFGEAVVPRPGGDKIGRRRLDTHLNGILKLGAQMIYHEQKEPFHALGQTIERKLYPARRSVCHRYRQPADGCRFGGRRDGHLQCRL